VKRTKHRVHETASVGRHIKVVCFLPVIRAVLTLRTGHITLGMHNVGRWCRADAMRLHIIGMRFVLRTGRFVQAGNGSFFSMKAKGAQAQADSQQLHDSPTAGCNSPRREL
jgi:hypothetical protein